MSLQVPNTFVWFLPGIEKYFSLNLGILSNQLFKYSTKELFYKFKQRKEFNDLLFAERIILEHTQDNIFSKELLEYNLKVFEKVEGELFYFRKPPSNKFPFIQITEKIYFYPKDWGGIKKLVLNLIKENKFFYSTYYTFEKEIHVKDIENTFRIIKSFGFQRFGEKALKNLSEIFPKKSWEDISKISKDFVKKDENYVLGITTLDIWFNVEVKIKGKGINLFVCKKEDLEKSDILKNLEGKTGLLLKKDFEKFYKKHASPFAYVFSAFEHARRLKNQAFQFFDGFTYHVMGDIFYEWEDYGRALYWYEIGRPFTKQIIELLLSKSAIYFLIGDFEKAKLLIQEAFSYREDPILYYNLGLIYLQLGKKDLAKNCFEKAFMMKNEVCYREALISILWEEKDYDKILALLDNQKDLSIKEKAILGKICFFKKDFKKAFEILKEFLTIPQRDGEVLFFLAWLYLNLHKEKEVAKRLFWEAKKKLGKEVYEKLIEEFGGKVV